jgi:hypothetical protein
MPLLCLVVFVGCVEAETDNSAVNNAMNANNANNATMNNSSSNNSTTNNSTTNNSTTNNSTTNNSSGGEFSHVETVMDDRLLGDDLRPFADHTDSCGVSMTFSIDWPSHEAAYGDGPAGPGEYDELEALNYCYEIVSSIAFDCENDDGLAEKIQALGVTHIYCYYDAELPTDDIAENLQITVEPPILAFGYNWWTGNLRDQVFDWERSL